jgi:Tol biopolymer transport system component
VWSPDAAALAFTRSDDGFARVHVARRDGTGVTRIGSGTTLAWSPDGAWIAVSGCSDDGGLCLLPAGGGDPMHLSPAWAAAASWSPDGTRLAFSTETETYVLTLSPRAVVRVGPDGASAPEWSPDGSAIAFLVLDQDIGGQSYVAVASPTRADVRRVTSLADAVSAPSWMPDGRRVVYASRMNDNDFEIVVHDTASSTVTVLTDNQLEDVEPTWSPRGSRIAFVRGRRDAEDFEFADGYHVLGSIYVMNADGTEVRRLTHRRHDHSPSWSPDGTRIVFEREGRLYIVNTFGTPRIRRLTALAETSRAPAWSPNGKLIAFDRYYAEDDAYSIAVVSPNGGRARRLTDADANDRAPSWAPDARSLAFQRDVITENDQLFTLRLRPRRAAPITTPTPCEDSYGFVTAASLPAWSRDGSRIAFVRATAVANPQIYSVSRAGRGEKRVTTGPAAAMWPDWSPR